MPKTLFPPLNEDICPNCGTICSANDVLCSNCSENLDDLFEQLPDEKISNDVFKMAAMKLPSLNWLTPLLLILSPLFVSLVTVLLVVPNMPKTPGREPLQLIWFVVSSSTLEPSGLLLVSLLPLFLFTTPHIRSKIGQRSIVALTTLFSILSALALWLGLHATNIMSISSAYAFFGLLIFILIPADWVYFLIVGGMILIVLNWMVIIGQGKTA